MTKFLKPKNMRRLALLSVLAAPIIYLFGGLFTGLMGAHGEIVFADDKDVEYNLVETTALVPQSEYQFVWDSDVLSRVTYQLPFRIPFTCNGVEYATIDFRSTTYAYYITADGRYQDVTRNGVLRIEYQVINFEGLPNFPYLDVGSLYQMIPSANPVNNADFVFGQMFSEDNFVSKIGEDVFTGDINSQPICQLIQFADSNMFDIEQYSWGKFLYGYVYYAFTSVLIYEIVSIALSLLLMPLKVVDTLEERIHTS